MKKISISMLLATLLLVDPCFSANDSLQLVDKTKSNLSALISHQAGGSSQAGDSRGNQVLQIIEASKAERIDTISAHTKFAQSTSTLKSIGESAQSEYKILTRECERLRSQHARPPVDSGITGVVINPGVGVLAPFFNDHLFVVNLPGDNMIERFDHNRWALNLSRNNAGSVYLNIVAYTATNLADGLFFSARHCNDHSDTPGHFFIGTNGCCQYYTRGIRQELIATAACASRHSRAHDIYVQQFNKFDGQVALLHAHHANLVRTYPGILVGQAYPVKPVNNYTPFRFRDWLLQLAGNNNTPAICDTLTDLDDPGMMADKVYVSARHSNCGHGTMHSSTHNANGPYQYTSWNWCGHHHYTRSMKIELFEVALGLARNQTYHDTYVAQALQFEAATKAMITTYWHALRGWNGVPVPFGGLGGVVVQQQALAPHNDELQTLRSDRELLKNHLERVVPVLESAARCSSIADDMLATGIGVLGQVGVGASIDDRNEMLTLMARMEFSTLESRVRDLTIANEGFSSQITELLETNKTLTGHIAKRDQADMIRDIEEKSIATGSDREMENLSDLLGEMRYELTGADSDLDRFRGLSFKDKIRRARTLIFNPVRDIIRRVRESGSGFATAAVVYGSSDAQGQGGKASGSCF